MSYMSKGIAIDADALKDELQDRILNGVSDDDQIMLDKINSVDDAAINSIIASIDNVRLWEMFDEMVSICLQEVIDVINENN